MAGEGTYGLSNDSVKAALKGGPRRSSRLSSGATLALSFAVAISVGIAIFALPRPVAPDGPPALVITEAEAREVRERDAETAASAPTVAEAEALGALYAEYSRREIAGGDSQAGATRRITVIASAARAFRATHGEPAIAGLRATAVTDAERALAGELTEARRAELLGTFEQVLARYGAIEGDSVIAAPFVVRTLFAARWNTAHGLPATLGMSDTELRAYWGWLALEADGAPIGTRLAALDAYEEAGGARAAEARGALLYEAGRTLEAANAYQRAFEEGGSLRLRNHALAAFAAASVDTTEGHP
jgi:hypothetical protein